MCKNCSELLHIVYNGEKYHVIDFMLFCHQNGLDFDKEIEKKIKRYSKDTVFILSGNEDVMYCSKCWDDERKLVQVTRDDDYYKCPKCNNHNIFYEKSKYYHMLNQGNDSNIV